MQNRRASDYQDNANGVLVELSDEGLAVVDDDGRYLSVNPAGCSILGHDETTLLGSSSVFLGSGNSPQAGRSNEGSAWIGTSEVEFEIRRAPTATGRIRWAVRFCYADRAVKDRRKLAAFTRTASAVAYEDRLDVVLDKLAVEVRDTVDLATCAVVLVDEVSGALNHVGKAGLPDDYPERIEACRRLGAPLITVSAIDECRVVVAREWREQVLTDPRWAPVQEIARAGNWETYVVVPLIVREKAIGAVAGFFTEHHDPGLDDIRFMVAMADQAAIAVANAHMFAKLEIQAAREERRKLARDMHDSVTQALFSLSLRTKALELGVESGESVDVVEQLRQLHELVCGAQAEMRALIMHRRRAPLGEEGLIPSIRKHLAAIAAREGIELVVESNDEFHQFGEALEEDLFMVVGEAVHNVVKHAHATLATVRIILAPRQNGPSVCLSITDNGSGIAEGQSGHQSFGLVSMNERLKAHGGHLSVRSKPAADPEHGTTVCCIVPLTTPTHMASSDESGREQ